MAPLLLLLLLQTAAATTTFPSCLTANTTWDSSLITSFTPDIPSPELCQQLCVDSPPCQAVTWTSPATRLPFSCLTFSTTTTELPCTDCVSGPARCSCSSQGECQAKEGNIVDVFPDIPTVEVCAALCLGEDSCQFFTYLGDNNVFR